MNVQICMYTRSFMEDDTTQQLVTINKNNLKTPRIPRKNIESRSWSRLDFQWTNIDDASKRRKNVFMIEKRTAIGVWDMASEKKILLSISAKKIFNKSDRNVACTIFAIETPKHVQTRNKTSNWTASRVILNSRIEFTFIESSIIEKSGRIHHFREYGWYVSKTFIEATLRLKIISGALFGSSHRQ